MLLNAGCASGWADVADDRKRQVKLTLWLTEREAADLVELAKDQDRKPGEMGRVALRLHMYGIVGRRCADENESDRLASLLSGTDLGE